MSISIKQGRGPSFMGGVAGIIVTIFAIIMAFHSASLSKNFEDDFFGNTSQMMRIFPWLFVITGIIIVIYNFYNVFAKDRLSQIDIVDSNEEPDPFHRRFEKRDYNRSDRSSEREILDAISKRERRKPNLARSPPRSSRRRIEGDFCPYCGKKVSKDFDYCPGCGRDI